MKYRDKSVLCVTKYLILSKLGNFEVKTQKIDWKFYFPNIFTLLKILSSLLVTSCECERSFSAMRRLKSYSRSRYFR